MKALRAIAVACLSLAGLAAPVSTRAAVAASADPHEQVFDLASIQAAHEVCGFQLSDEQVDVLEQRRQALIDQDAVPAAEIASVTSQVATSLQRQVADGVCKPNSPEALLYRHKLAEYGLL